MSRHLARNIYHLMRRAARQTPVDALKRDGRRTVSVLNFRDIQDLIERAVENTLRRRGVKLDGPGIHEEVRLEFLALMRERDMLRLTVDELLQEQERLQENRTRLADELEAATEAYASERRALVSSEEASEVDRLRAQVEARLRDVLAPTDADVSERAVALAVAAFDEVRGLVVGQAEQSHTDRLQRLERRIEKLKRKLAETEDMLQRARTEGVDEGIPGEAIEPGLRMDDPDYRTKKELLGEIFRLNVELREMLNHH